MSVNCVKIKPDNEIDKLLYKYFTCEMRKGWIEIGNDKYCMPEYYTTIADEVENLEVKDTDIFLTSHPKTGTTWTQEMIWMIVHKLDFEGAKENIYYRVPFLEFQGIFDYTSPKLEHIRKNAPPLLVDSVNLCKNYIHTPRIIKTHMPFDLLPKQIRDKTRKPKIIHVIRNAKDTCVSHFYHCRLLEGYSGSLEDFCSLFLAGRVAWSPYWKHVLSFWNRRDEYNILFIKYEDMKRNLPSVILQVADFLGYSLTNEQLSLLEDHLSFKKMKNNTSLNMEAHCEMSRKLLNVDGTFIRSGIVGSYKTELSPEMIDLFEKWTEEELAGSGLTIDENV